MKHFWKTKKILVVSLLLVFSIATVAATMAYFISDTNTVENTFGVGIMDQDVDVDINEKVYEYTKKVCFENTNDSKSNAFIRARIVFSPESLYGGVGDDAEANAHPAKVYISGREKPWEYNEKDGFYYYLKAVPVGGETTYLMQEIHPGREVKEDFEITVYQEAVSTIAQPTDAVTVDEIKARFDEVATKQDVAE